MRKAVCRSHFVLRAGVVGSQLPALQAPCFRSYRETHFFFATDGVRSDFSVTLSAPGESAKGGRQNSRAVSQRKMTDALVLVAR